MAIYLGKKERGYDVAAKGAKDDRDQAWVDALVKRSELIVTPELCSDGSWPMLIDASARGQGHYRMSRYAHDLIGTFKSL